jgi:hypothetical protein
MEGERCEALAKDFLGQKNQGHSQGTAPSASSMGDKLQCQALKQMMKQTGVKHSLPLPFVTHQMWMTVLYCQRNTLSFFF